MAARSVWKGFVRFSLVAVPVKAYTANNSSGSGKVSLNQLHRDCHSRVKYQKVCPTHGELAADQIVSGYEFDAGRYVVIEPEELDKLRSPAEKAINVQGFINAKDVDPVYYAGKTWYLVPDGPIGQLPYAIIHRALKESGRQAFAQVVIGGHEQLVLLRPVGRLLVMSYLSFSAEVKSPSEFEPEVTPVDVPASELKLAKSLTDAMVVHEFDLSVYTDKYAENLTALVQAKIKGEEVVSPAAEESPMKLNLMEALQQSVAEAKKTSGKKPGKPPLLEAPGTAAKAGDARKRKSS